MAGLVQVAGHYADAAASAVVARYWPGGRFWDSQCERHGASVFTSFSPACLADAR
jgi:hypothetical protein